MGTADAAGTAGVATAATAIMAVTGVTAEVIMGRPSALESVSADITQATVMPMAIPLTVTRPPVMVTQPRPMLNPHMLMVHPSPALRPHQLQRPQLRP